MRSLLFVVLGLVTGAMGATFGWSALHQGTPFHRGVMTVMQHHMGVLRANVRAGQCNAKASADRFARMRATAGDVREAFPEMDAAFYTGAQHLDMALDRAIAAAPDTCAALTAALAPVGDACQSCHRQYR
jgi:cytochrome c556